ncbi:DUF6452 family protein [Aureisphaera galaxeae]|uniref:DUF6452 family protein n=1 Tax=Aureisphaera galaxeae TaxID=1538023 RepID=UPI00234FD891|nr:DUF6452 family protein [Aureisphaera galaxeae]MDC8004409.1 DUF6452 family protein [Aureisphaera galaxeae]
MKQKLIWICFALVSVLSCTKDDICEQGIPTTPLLVIEFKDANNNTESKAVQSLKVLLTDADNTEVFVSTTSDTLISLPLNTEATFTEYQFIANSNDDTNMDTDLLTFNYTREDIYINRACAFKVIFNDFNANLEDEASNWIQDITIQKTTIEDEIEAHLTIFH